VEHGDVLVGILVGLAAIDFFPLEHHCLDAQWLVFPTDVFPADPMQKYQTAAGLLVETGKFLLFLCGHKTEHGLVTDDLVVAEGCTRGAVLFLCLLEFGGDQFNALHQEPVVAVLLGC
jgi:hypothetical protein